MPKKNRILVEGAIVAALAMALSLIPFKVGVGGAFSISLGQIPLTIFALRRGWRPALLVAFVWGMLHFPMGDVYYLSIPQVIIEYPLAFTFAGFAGFAGVAAKPLQKALKEKSQKGLLTSIFLGGMVGTVARYFWHFVAGVVFWGAYAVWGLGPIGYSLVANGISGLLTGLMSSLVCVIIAEKAPYILIPKEVQVISLD